MVYLAVFWILISTPVLFIAFNYDSLVERWLTLSLRQRADFLVRAKFFFFLSSYLYQFHLCLQRFYRLKSQLDLSSVISGIIIGLLTGLLTGVLSGFYTSSYYRKKAYLDQALTSIKRLCPYRKDNVREGDGLSETGWSLRILGEVMKETKFSYEGSIIIELGNEICNVDNIDEQDERLREERDRLKEKWYYRVYNLYPNFKLLPSGSKALY
ncbi:MAG: hypothetical protein HC921_20460 [Synechococcaceae cyanobacterium SM2_3_1]|nr:hypothetical protein [Synechococcaceae cyanobacterium SM2_3_1]